MTTHDNTMISDTISEAENFALLFVLMNAIKARSDTAHKHNWPRATKTNLVRYCELLIDDACDSVDDHSYVQLHKTSLTHRPRPTSLFAELYVERFKRDRAVLKGHVLSKLYVLLSEGMI